SGKSTFLRCCNGLELPEQGDITLCGKALIRQGKPLPEKQLNALRQDVGMVFQSFNLFPHLSVLENLCAAPVMLRGLDKTT
ncbi:ATP-binding cassette domain-containing protein, partial [Klebsiella pneumoniae]|uniref:ATP-binding cassette domain-containing protein n=1 Tax=Klebsiella pneumoniae TaxID=573 RepID=UPI001B8B9A30